MIRVICLNPVIDRLYYINDFQVGTKFYEIPPQTFVGGKGINIARVLSQMGQECILYGFVGGNNGHLVEEEMEKYHVKFRAFHTQGETRTTINIIDRYNHRETEITEPGVMVGNCEQEVFLGVLKKELQPGDMVVCSGIPMKGMEEDIYAQISEICRKNQNKCILDATGVYLKKSFPGQYYFLKPNLTELAELSGRKAVSEEQVYTVGRQLQQQGVENLLISMGGDGGIFFDETYVYKIMIPQTEVVSTIGSGDSAVAGFCYGIVQNMDKLDCVKLAMACGICNAEVSNVGFVERGRVWELFELVKVERCKEGESL